MLFRKLVLEDFGLYRGVQELNLTPRQDRPRASPVILFGGKNGAGKSTIFEAILLCLYGKAALGERVRQSDYLDYLFQRIHRSSLGLGSSRASVSVEFDFVHAGVRRVYEVTRSWVANRATSASIDVTLDLRQDGQRLDELDHAHWDAFLRELIPPGLSQLFFFDGERIQRLAEQDSHELGRSVKSLLNLNVVERLSADLGVYVTKHARSTASKNDQLEIDRLETHQGRLTLRADQLRAKQAEVQTSKLDHITATIDELEQKLRFEGSELAEARDELVAERGRLVMTIRQAEERLRQLAAGTLPFVLCPSLLRDLRSDLATSQDELSQSALEKISTGTATVLEQLVSGTLDGADTIRPLARRRIADALSRELRDLLCGTESTATARSVLHLSASEKGRLISWIDSALGDTLRETERLGRDLERATRRLQEVEVALAQVPSEEVLRVIAAKLNAFHGKLGAAQQEMRGVQDELDRVVRELADVERRLERLTARVQEGQRAQERVGRVRRAQAALKEYLVAVTRLKLEQLEQEVTSCFQEVCRKGDLVQEIRIDPGSFAITLYDRNGHTMSKERLSAGEKQIFAVALLWALGRTSGRPLPVIIDTPLARLDSDHRRLLVEQYLPAASHQVLVLSTDTEVDSAAFAALGPAISHAYHLAYDEAECATITRPGYFWADNVPETAARKVLQGSG